jgi:arylsulfatase A-like enzyme
VLSALLRSLPRVVVALLVGGAAVVAWRAGGGADARTPTPRPDSLAASTASTGVAAPGHGAEAYEVKLRLTEALSDARIEVPSLGAARERFDAYWRKMRGPWVRPQGVAGQLVTMLSLRTSSSEMQWTVQTGSGTWVPEARVWNMNEGSYDQRESIYAPAPATLAFRIAVPQHARLRFATSVLLPTLGTTVFEVAVVDAGGEEKSAWRSRVAGTDAKRWADADVDLAPWGGQQVELQLRTSADKPQPGEKHVAAAPPPDAGADAAAEGPAVSPLSLALWGDPVIVAREPTRVPYDVLWVVVDAQRPDIAASLHDDEEDAAKLAAPRPPLEALLPKMPGVLPSLDRLGARGVRFEHAWSAGAWTRPGTIAMLVGARSSEVGIDPTSWLLPPEEVTRWYSVEPPLVPLVLRKSGVESVAFVNNFFMTGYAAVGVDMGFEHVVDHRYRTRDTAEITRDTLAWLESHKDERFFMFVNYNSPHEPYDPTKEALARVPPPPIGPRDEQIRRYVAEATKDDAAIGQLLDALDRLDLAKSTLVVVTADHGETLSTAHGGYGLEHMPVRFHHAVGNFEETTRVPIVMALPGKIDGGGTVKDRIRTIDIAPTILDVEGLEADPRMSGRSVMPLVRGEKTEPRAVVSEGRGSRAVLWGKWRLIVHDSAPRPSDDKDPDAKPSFGDELYDLEDDPGERHEVAKFHPDVVADMRSRLSAALANVPAADVTPPAQSALPTVHFRFAGAGQARRVTGAITAGDGKHGVVLSVDPQGVAREAFRIDGPQVDFALATVPEAALGFDLRVDPPGAPLAWKLWLDDAPWPEHAVFAGPFGPPATAAKNGLAGDDARAEVFAPAQPLIDPSRDLGLFVTRDRPGEAAAAGVAPSEEAAREMQRVLQQWGYAHGSH